MDEKELKTGHKASLIHFQESRLNWYFPIFLSSPFALLFLPFPQLSYFFVRLMWRKERKAERKFSTVNSSFSPSNISPLLIPSRTALLHLSPVGLPFSPLPPPSLHPSLLSGGISASWSQIKGKMVIFVFQRLWPSAQRRNLEVAHVCVCSEAAELLGCKYHIKSIYLVTEL